MAEEIVSQQFRVRYEDGTETVVLQYVEVIRHHSNSSPSQTFKGPRDYRLQDGRGVVYIDDKTFRIFDTDEILRKIED